MPDPPFQPHPSQTTNPVHSAPVHSARAVIDDAREQRGQDDDRAMLLFEWAASLARDDQQHDLLAEALDGIAKLEHERGDSHSALFHFREALELYREGHDANGEAVILCNLGSLYTDLGNFNTALEYLLQAAELLEGQDRPARTAMVAANLARVYDALGQAELAEPRYRQALDLARASGHQLGEAILCMNYGDFHRRHGRFAQTEELVRRALELSSEDGATTAGALQILGLLQRDRGETTAALQSLAAARVLAREHEDLDAVIDVIVSEAETRLELGSSDEARGVLTEGIRIAEESGRHRALGQLLKLLSRALELDGDTRAALELARRAHTVEADVLRGEAEQRTRDLAARHELERARAELENQRQKYDAERVAKEKVEREAATRLHELQRQALYDALTGLPNRLLLADRFRVAVEQAAQGGARLALGVLDLNKFKRINDTLGHHVGDQLLIEVARRLEPAMRAEDTVARTGGDEFVFLIRDLTRPDAVMAAAQRVVRAFDRTFVLGPHDLNVKPSVGFAVYPDDALTYEDLFEKADRAMYEAKARGSGVELYGANSGDRVAPVTLEGALHNALRNEELDVVYQPLARPDGTLRGAEALLRWKHPHFGSVPPAEFLPLAETTGLSVVLGAWVLTRACREAATWHKRVLSVNLSERQFLHPDLADTVQHALQAASLAPHLLELEVGEEVLARHAARAPVILGALKQLGVRVVVDDFGAGFTSLSVLKHRLLDGVKIDRSLLHDPRQGAGEHDGLLLTAVVAMLKTLQLDVIAKGVETEEQWRILSDHGVSAMQGYLFARPQSAVAIRGQLHAPA